MFLKGGMHVFCLFYTTATGQSEIPDQDLDEVKGKNT